MRVDDHSHVAAWIRHNSRIWVKRMQWLSLKPEFGGYDGDDHAQKLEVVMRTTKELDRRAKHEFKGLYIIYYRGKRYEALSIKDFPAVLQGN